MSAEIAIADPGLQPERTALAWARTTVSLSTAAAVLLRWAWVYGTGVIVAVVALVACVLTAFVSTQRRYRTMSRAIASGAGSTNSLGVLALSAATLLSGIAALVCVLQEVLSEL